MNTQKTLYLQQIKDREAALERALDIRKFEIGLYWQRAAYCWALIAVTFAAYFSILGAEHMENKAFMAYIVSWVGVIFTWAWFLVNRGSKFWQENWEYHVDMLEDESIGALFKTVLYKPIGEGWFEKNITSPLPFSVSRINQFISAFIISIWIIFAVFAITEVQNIRWFQIVLATLFALGATIFCGIMGAKCQTYSGKYNHIKMKIRETEITGQESL